MTSTALTTTSPTSRFSGCALYSAEVTIADRRLGNFLEKTYDLTLLENYLPVLLLDYSHALQRRSKVLTQIRLWTRCQRSLLSTRVPVPVRSL
jgi:hypothetical protein